MFPPLATGRSPPTMRLFLPCLCVLVISGIATAGGCRSLWVANAPPEEAFGAGPLAGLGPQMRPAPKTVPIELFFVRSDDSDPELQDALWGCVDEQVFNESQRRLLAANGLRAGVITGQLPATLATRLQPEAVPENRAAVPAAPEATPPVVKRMLRILPGQPSDVVATKSTSELILLEHDGTGVRGTTYRDASAHFSLRVWPAADGRVRIDLAPTIRHGAMERTWVGEDGVFKLETGQREQVLENLRCSTELAPDALLVVGPGGDASSTVGDAFFRDPQGGGSGRRLLAVRPLLRSLDPMFSPDAASSADQATGPQQALGE